MALSRRGLDPWPEVPVAMSLARRGTFSVAAIDFFMAGYWELYLDLTPPGGAVDPLTFKLCIPDD